MDMGREEDKESELQPFLPLSLYIYIYISGIPTIAYKGRSSAHLDNMLIIPGSRLGIALCKATK